MNKFILLVFRPKVKGVMASSSSFSSQKLLKIGCKASESNFQLLGCCINIIIPSKRIFQRYTRGNLDKNTCATTEKIKHNTR